MCQNFIFLSLLPPPVASKDFDHGQNETALTAALWGSVWTSRGDLISLMSHIVHELSLPPTARFFEY